jgi:ribosomal-protein-alanine N-acetyltransferase
LDCPLQTEHLHLRPFELSDNAAVYALCNDIEVARTTLLIPHPYSMDAAEAWIITNKAAADNGTRYAFAIEDLKTACLYGSVSLNIDMQHSRAELSYWIGSVYWGKGFATEATQRIIQFGFESLNLHRIWAAAMSKNLASIRVMIHANMQYEGTFRQHVLKWDVFEDITFYAILKTEYETRFKLSQK